MATLTLGPGENSAVSLTRFFWIGRLRICNLMFEDGVVSRFHATIERTPQGHLIRDMKSLNGTFVNQRRIRTCYLMDGDIITLGLVDVRYSRDTAGESLLRHDSRVVRSHSVMLVKEFLSDGPHPAEESAVEKEPDLPVAQRPVADTPAPDIGEFMEKALDRTLEALRADHAFVVLLQGAGDSFIPRFARMREAEDFVDAPLGRPGRELGPRTLNRPFLPPFDAPVGTDTPPRGLPVISASQVQPNPRFRGGVGRAMYVVIERFHRPPDASS